MLPLEKEITIQGLLQEVFKRWWLVAVCVILCGAIFFTYSSMFIPERFTSVGSVYVDNKADVVVGDVENNTANLYDLTTAEMLVDTYIELFSSYGFYEMIQQKAKLEYHPKALRAMTTFSRVEETGVIYVNVDAPTPKDAQKICAAVLKYANYHIKNIMEVGSVKVIDNASLPDSRSYPSVTKNTLLGMILGMLVACGIIFVVNYFDVHVKTVEDIETKYDLVVLGTIPNMFDKKSSSGGAKYE